MSTKIPGKCTAESVYIWRTLRCPAKLVQLLGWGKDQRKGERMARRSYRPEQIINKLREAEVLICQGSTVGEAAGKIGVPQRTFYH